MSNRSWVSMLVIAASALTFASCAPLPGPQQAVVDEALGMFREGVTTRNEVVSVLGPPRMRRGDQVYVYNLSEGRTDIVPGGITRSGLNRYVRIEFGGTGTLTDMTRYEGPGAAAQEFLAAAAAEDAVAKQFQPNPRACAAYVMFSQHNLATDFAYLFLDGETVSPVAHSGPTFGGTAGYYVVLELPPGAHRLGVSQPPPPGTRPEALGSISFECNPGELLFISHRIGLCGTGLCLSSLDAADGKREVLRRKRVVSLLD